MKRGLMKKVLIAAAALGMVFMLFFNGPTSYRLQRLEDAAISQELRYRVAGMSIHGQPPRNVVWRVFRDDGSWPWRQRHSTQSVTTVAPAICTLFEMLEAPVSPSSWPRTLFGNVSDFRQSPFYGQAGSGRSQPGDGGMIYRLYASGVCLNPRIKMIRGTTSEGRSLSVTPDNGFWCIYLPNTNPSEIWKAVEALNSRGRALYELPLR